MSQKPHSILEDIGGDIGYTATAALVDWFGGANLCVPSVADENHPIGKVIGMPAFTLFVKHYGGETVWLPLGYQREMDRRDRMIGALIASGVGTKQIAALASMSESHVAHVRMRLESQGLIPLILRRAGLADESKFAPHRKRQAKVPGKKPTRKW